MPSTLSCPAPSRQLDFPRSMNCPACGAALAPTAKYCHKCGAQVSGVAPAGWRAGLPWAVAGAGLGGAQADTIRRVTATHLFAFMLRARALELTHDTPGALRAYRAFLQHEAAERARRRPEYDEHAQNLDAFRDQAKQVTAGKAARGS